MAVVHRVTLQATITDNFSRFIDLISPSSSAIEGEIIDGVFSFEANNVQLAVLQKGTSPSTNVISQKWPANSFLGLGPNTLPGTGYRIEELWFKNTTGGSAGVVTLTGSVRSDS